MRGIGSTHIGIAVLQLSEIRIPLTGRGKVNKWMQGGVTTLITRHLS
jgi:hypothetical protein